MPPRDPLRGVGRKAVTMRIIQSIILKLFGLAILAGAGVFVAMRFHAPLRAQVFAHGQWFFHTHYFYIAAGLVIFFALIALMPRRRKRVKNTISFPGIRGNVTIELDSVEANLSRIVGKMPEVKKIRIKVAPTEDNRRAVVRADVLIYKGTKATSAHEIANSIAERLNDAAVSILGVEEVTKVDLNVRDIIVDAKRLAAAQAREKAAKIEEPPVAAVAAEPVALEEPVIPEEPVEVAEPAETEKAADADLALGPFDAAPAGQPEEAPVVDPGFGFSLADEVHSVEEPPAVDAHDHAVENTGFEALTLEPDAPAANEAEPKPESKQE